MFNFGKNNRVIINGVTYDLPGGNITIRDGKIVSNGKTIVNIGMDTKVELHGDVKYLDVDGSVEVHGNAGSIGCGGNCAVNGDVVGNINAGGNVTCGNVNGDINAGGSVRCTR